MRYDRESGREQPFAVDCGPTGPIGLQPVRLKPEPFASGAWVLPSISADVPLSLTRGATASDVNGSVFALEAHAAGVRLPAGDFTTVKESLRQQLTAYVSKRCDPDEPLMLDFILHLAEDEIDLVLSAESQIQVLELKPIIERLNEHANGLGWFVYETLSTAGTRYPIYDDSWVLSICEMLWFDPSMTDEEYVENILCENGEKRNGRDDEEILNEYTAGFRPSDVQEMLTGNLLALTTHQIKSGTSGEDQERPVPTSLRAAQLLLKKDMPDDLRQVVKDAIALRKQVNRKDQMVKQSSPLPPDSQDEYCGQPYGASCIAVWQANDFCREAINHFEEMEMNTGESGPVHMHFQARANDDESVKQLVKAFKDVVDWHSAVGRVLKHFRKGD